MEKLHIKYTRMKDKINEENEKPTHTHTQSHTLT